MLLLSECDFKNLSEAISNICTSIALLIGGGWALYRYVYQGERLSKMQFELEVLFVHKVEGQWLVEIVAHLENKGYARQKIDVPSFVFRVLYTKEGEGPQNVSLDNGASQALFSHKLLSPSGGDWQWLPTDLVYIFVEPGVKRKVTSSFFVPGDANALWISSRFSYTDKKRENDSAGIVISVPHPPKHAAPHDTNS